MTKSLTHAIRLVTAAAFAVLGTGIGTAAPASAAIDDSFVTYTTDGCGAANFVDYGTWPDGSTNDDYAVVHDYCSDGHGVRAYAWLDGFYLGSKYNGNGHAGAPVYWDPFGNVLAGDVVGLQVCLVDGSGDTTPSKCVYAEHVSQDG
jgi:hypothetical protein